MDVTEVPVGRNSVSWTSYPVSFYMHKINRSKLYEYFHQQNKSKENNSNGPMLLGAKVTKRKLKDGTDQWKMTTRSKTVVRESQSDGNPPNDKENKRTRLTKRKLNDGTGQEMTTAVAVVQEPRSDDDSSCEMEMTTDQLEMSALSELVVQESQILSDRYLQRNSGELELVIDQFVIALVSTRASHYAQCCEDPIAKITELELKISDLEIQHKIELYRKEMENGEFCDSLLVFRRLLTF